MNKIRYKEKCKALFKKAKSLGVELIFYPEQFNCHRLNCIWYGGTIATINVSKSVEIQLNAYGDVRAFLCDRKGKILVGVKDKENSGAFTRNMKAYLKTDRQLKKATESKRLDIQYNNWIEYDGVIKNSTDEDRNLFVDFGLIDDNILNSNVLCAIREALNSLKEIVEHITDIATHELGLNI